MSGLFITGVGTGVGKTLVATILCHQWRRMGRRVTALKPVVSGFVADDPESDPALLLRSVGITPRPESIASISPWRFAAPISPHLAARRENRSVSLVEIAQFCREKTAGPGSLRLIEGAGGLMSPMSSDGTCLDLIAALGEPVILVTGTYLGALSHTLTALAALRGRSAVVRGLIVSESVESVGLGETVKSLREFGCADLPIVALPRLIGDVETRWRTAPWLSAIHEACDE